MTNDRDFAVLSYAVSGTTNSSSGTGTLTTSTDVVAFRYLSAETRHELRIPNRDWGILGFPTRLGASPFTQQQVTVGTGANAFTYALDLLIPGSANPVIALTYSSFGSWTASYNEPSDATKTQQNFGQFAYGKATPVGALPASGAGAYSGVVYDPYVVQGTIAANVNFGTREISGTFTSQFADGTGAFGSPGACPFNGLLSPTSTAVRVTLATTGNCRGGIIDLQFTGPNGEEFLALAQADLVVSVIDTNVRKYYLAGVGKR